MTDLKIQTPGTHDVVTECAGCGSTDYVDVPISGGRVRRDCGRCGHFLSWPVWHDNQQANNSAAVATPNLTDWTAEGNSNSSSGIMTSAIPHELADQINAQHQACVAAANNALDHAMNCGDLLIEAKVVAGHGNWEESVGKSFRFSVQTARAYIRLARHRELLEAKRQHADVLSLREAYKLIARPETDLADSKMTVDKAVADVATGVEAGETSASDPVAITGLPEQQQKQIADGAKRTGTTLTLAKTGTASSPDAFDGAITIAVRPPKPMNGRSVVSGKDRELALRDISSLCRRMKKLGLFAKYDAILSEMIRCVRDLK